MKEAEIEDYLCGLVQQVGGRVRKVRWISRKSAPDRAVFLPVLGLVWVELKKPGEEPTVLQAKEHEMMRRYGERVEVIDSFEKVDRLIREEADRCRERLVHPISRRRISR